MSNLSILSETRSFIAEWRNSRGSGVGKVSHRRAARFLREAAGTQSRNARTDEHRQCAELLIAAAERAEREANAARTVSEEEIIALLPAAFRVLGIAMPMTPEEVARAEAESEEAP